MTGSAGCPGGPEMEALHAQILCSRCRRPGRGDGNGPLVAVERGGDERQGCPFKRRDIAPRDHVQLEESSRGACRKPDVTRAIPACADLAACPAAGGFELRLLTGSFLL